MFCLLNHSAAFSTSTIKSLSFASSSVCCSWLCSHLVQMSNVKNNLSSLYISTCSQGSVLGALHLIKHTTPFSTLIFSLPLNHKHYTDHTQLFFSFCPSIFESNITHLQNTLLQISSWMTANLLTLSSSKTEFLLIRHKKQLAKTRNSPLNSTHSLCNLGFIFDEHLTKHQHAMADQISSLSISSYSHIPKLCWVHPYLNFKTASTVATSVVHSKLDYYSSLYYNLPKSQITHEIYNCLARAVVKASKSCYTTPTIGLLFGSK